MGCRSTTARIGRCPCPPRCGLLWDGWQLRCGAGALRGLPCRRGADLLPALRRATGATGAVVLADGFSCQTQIQDFAGAASTPPGRAPRQKHVAERRSQLNGESGMDVSLLMKRYFTCLESRRLRRRRDLLQRLGPLLAPAVRRRAPREPAARGLRARGDPGTVPTSGHSHHASRDHDHRAGRGPVLRLRDRHRHRRRGRGRGLVRLRGEWWTRRTVSPSTSPTLPGLPCGDGPAARDLGYLIICQV